MDKIENVRVEPLQKANFVKPYRLSYSQNGVNKNWEVISVHPSVSIIIFNTDKKKLVLVQQFRPPVYFSNYPRNERELPSSPVSPPSPSASSTGVQSIIGQSSQQTQTALQSLTSQETQTACDRFASQACTQSNDTREVCLSSQGTQSAQVAFASQAVQSVVAQISQATQSSSPSSCSAPQACCGGYPAQTPPAGASADRCSSVEAALSPPLQKALPTLPGRLGVTMELCAGIVDKDIPLREIARDEVLEECGYQVAADVLQEVITFRSGVGSSGDKQTLFYVEVTDAMKVGQGGGLASEGELIDVVELSVPEVRSLLQQREVMAPGGLLFALSWFLANKAAQYE